MLEIRDLHFDYGTRHVLSGVNLTAGEGDLIFLLGPNGVGKTTLFRCILGILTGYKGEILIDGESTAGLPAKKLASLVAYIPQIHNPAFSYSVLDMVLMGTNKQLNVFQSPGQTEKEIAREALEQVGMKEDSEREFDRLSGGEQQLVLVARALAQQTQILLMDEPTSSLDYGNQMLVLHQVTSLAKEGYTILLSCHNPQQAILYADRVTAMSGGTIIRDGSPREVMTEELMKELYGTDTKFVSTEYGVFIAPAEEDQQIEAAQKDPQIETTADHPNSPQ